MLGVHTSPIDPIADAVLGVPPTPARLRPSPPLRLALRLAAGSLVSGSAGVGAEPSAADRTRSLPRHLPPESPARRSMPARSPPPRTTITRLDHVGGHFSRAQGGQFSRAPKSLRIPSVRGAVEHRFALPGRRRLTSAAAPDVNPHRKTPKCATLSHARLPPVSGKPLDDDARGHVSTTVT